MDRVQIEGRVDQTLRGNIHYLGLCLFMGFTIMESGIDASSVGGFQAMVGFLKVFGYKDPTASSGWNIGTVPQQIISSFMTLGSAIGALSVGPLGSKLPRTWCIAMGCVVLLVATIIQATSVSLAALYVARILVGVGNGVIQTYCVVYIQETAPSYLRSLSSGILQSFLGVGTLIGTIIDNSTANISGRLCYQIPLFVMLIIPVIFLLFLPLLPETPRWLLQHQREEDALRSLRRLRRGCSDEVAISTEFEKMKTWSTHELEMMSHVSVVEMFRGTNLRRTILSCCVALVPSGIGGMFVLMYTTYFFEMAGVGKPFEDSVIVQCLGLLGTYVSFFFVQRLGGKWLLSGSAIVCGLSMLIMAVISSATAGSDSGLKGVVGMMAVYMFGFNGGIAIYSYPIAAEIPAQRLRAYTTGFAICIAFFFSWVTTFTAPYFINSANLNWGPKYGYIWFGSSAVVVVFLVFFLPDVSGRSLDDIDCLFESKVPTRHFKKYSCTEAGVIESTKEDQVEERATVYHLETSK